MRKTEFFKINTSAYVPGTNYDVVRPASINNPKDNSVMFITKSFMDHSGAFDNVKESLIFWPKDIGIPQNVAEKNAVFPCEDPHLTLCEFFKDNGIKDTLVKEKFQIVDGAYIAEGAQIGEGTIIMPGVYIGGEVEIGKNCEIGAGVKLVGPITIGNNVTIRENAVLGALSLTTDRDEDGNIVPMPQFGGITVEDNVRIGANTVIARGAIDDTILYHDCKISGLCYISHNCKIGAETLIVANTFMYGSSSVGEQSLISGSCGIANYVHVGNRCVLGMSSLATKDIADDSIAYGTPAKIVRKNKR